LVREFLARFFGFGEGIAFGVEVINPSFEFTKDWKEICIETSRIVGFDSFVRKDDVVKDQCQKES